MKGSGIGGQAVMEGVMMKNGSNYAVAVRKPDGDIIVDTRKFKKTFEGVKFFDLPIARGIIAFIDSLRLGVGTLMYSADFAIDDEEEEKNKKDPDKQKSEDKIIMTLSVVLAVVLAIGIFMVLPYFLSQLLKKVITSTVLLTLCEGLIRIALFVGYIAAISCMKDIKRVFMYHGAEHKSINCIENGLELNVANVRKSSRRHKRCGTSFLLIVMLISIIFFMFIRVETAWLRIVLRLLLIPVIAGVSYEFIRLAGRSDSKIVNLLSKPGLALQGLTTSEPDDKMIEVAIASVEAVFDWREFLENYDKTGSVCELAGETGENRTSESRTGDKTGKNADAGNKGAHQGNKNQGKNKGNKNHNKNTQNATGKGNEKKPEERKDQKKNTKPGMSGESGYFSDRQDVNEGENVSAGKTLGSEKPVNENKPANANKSAGDGKSVNGKKPVSENKPADKEKKASANKPADNEKTEKEEKFTGKEKFAGEEVAGEKKFAGEEMFAGGNKPVNDEKPVGAEKPAGEDKSANGAKPHGNTTNVRRLTRNDRLRGIKAVEPVEDDEDDDFLKALDLYFDDKKEEQ